MSFLVGKRCALLALLALKATGLKPQAPLGQVSRRQVGSICGGWLAGLSQQQPAFGAEDGDGENSLIQALKERTERNRELNEAAVSARLGSKGLPFGGGGGGSKPISSPPPPPPQAQEPQPVTPPPGAPPAMQAAAVPAPVSSSSPEPQAAPEAAPEAAPPAMPSLSMPQLPSLGALSSGEETLVRFAPNGASVGLSQEELEVLRLQGYVSESKKFGRPPDFLVVTQQPPRNFYVPPPMRKATGPFDVALELKGKDLAAKEAERKAVRDGAFRKLEASGGPVPQWEVPVFKGESPNGRAMCGVGLYRKPCSPGADVRITQVPELVSPADQ